MSFFWREKMLWTWRDPLRGLRHVTSKCITEPGRQLWYLTWCGLRLSVDDVNDKTKTGYVPTCFACIVASIPDVLEEKV